MSKADDAKKTVKPIETVRPAPKPEPAAVAVAITGPQSAVITGPEALVSHAIQNLREHGDSLAVDGKTIRGPITGRTVGLPGAEGEVVAYITVAFEIA